MTVLEDNQLEALPSLSTTELDSLGGALLDHRCESSRGTSTSYLRDWPHKPMPESAVQIAQDQDQDQDQSNAQVSVQVPLPFPTGSPWEPAIIEMTSTVASRLSSRTSEERRRQAEHTAFIADLFNVHYALPGVPPNEHSTFMQISTQLLCQLSSSQSRSRRDALDAAATMRDTMTSITATNAAERMHFAELFNSANATFFAELQIIIATETNSRQQDQANFRAGVAELRALQREAAHNTAKLVEFQSIAMTINEANGVV